MWCACPSWLPLIRRFQLSIAKLEQSTHLPAFQTVSFYESTFILYERNKMQSMYDCLSEIDDPTQAPALPRGRILPTQQGTLIDDRNRATKRPRKIASNVFLSFKNCLATHADNISPHRA